MGLLSDIAKKVKEIYSKADTAVGGYLPGASTPAQVAASKTVAPTPTPVASTSASSTPFSFTGTYDTATNTYTSPTGQNQSMAPTAAPAVAARQTSNQTSSASNRTNNSTSATTPITEQTPVAPVAPVTQNTQTPIEQSGSVTLPSVNQPSATVGKQPSYISQNGKFEYDFFSAEGQKERLQNVVDTMKIAVVPFNKEGIQANVGNGIIKTGLETVAESPYATAAAVASVAGLYKSVAGFIANSARIGTMASTPAGVAQLASSSPEAAGIVSNVATKAGTIAVNSKSTAQSIGFIAKTSASLGMKPETLGTILKALGWSTGTGISIGAVSSSFSGATEAKKAINQYIKESDDLQVKLREAGMDDLADELLDSNKDLKDGFDNILPYIPFVGKSIEVGKVEDYSYQLDKMTNKYDKQVKAQIDAAKAEAEKQKASDAEQKAKDDAAKLQEQRSYNEQQQQEQRRYNEDQKAEQRRYNEEQDAKKAEEERLKQLGIDATATATEGGSNLEFGLLSTSGDTVFVDKDKAAQYYFKAPYEELSEAQKRLLNLLKGE